MYREGRAVLQDSAEGAKEAARPRQIKPVADRDADAQTIPDDQRAFVSSELKLEHNIDQQPTIWRREALGRLVPLMSVGLSARLGRSIIGLERLKHFHQMVTEKEFSASASVKMFVLRPGTIFCLM
jgi:hypothetical protein